jgi:hypothetical protein
MESKGGENTVMIRKIMRYVLTVLVILGAIGGVGTLIGKKEATAPVAPQIPDYSLEKAFAVSFATTYLTISTTGDETIRTQNLENLVGNTSWLGNDPAISAVPKNAGSQKVVEAFPEEPNVVDTSHMQVPVLVEVQTSKSANPTWVQMNVPVGHDSTGLDVYAAPAIVHPFGTPGQVQDKVWSQSTTTSDITTEIQSNLNEFLPLFYSSSDPHSLAPFILSGRSVTPESGLFTFVSIQTLTAYGSEKGPWDVAVSVKVTDPVTQIQYLQSLTVGVVLQDGHYLVTGVVAN